MSIPKFFARDTLAGQFLSYFLGFYLFVLVVLVIGLNLQSSPQRLIALRASRAQLQIVFEQLLHKSDLAVIDIGTVCSDSPARDKALRTNPCLRGVASSAGWRVGSLGQRALQRQLKLGTQMLTYELAPDPLAQALRSKLTESGVTDLAVLDLSGNVLGRDPKADSAADAGPSSSGLGPNDVALSPFAARATILHQSFRLQLPAPFRAALILSGILVLPFFASRLFARRVTLPLRSLQQASESLASGSLETRILSTGNDEIGQLARTFNRMAEQLQDRDAQLLANNARLEEINRLKSLFLASVSHELRTPLTAILGQTQMLKDGLKGPITGPQEATLEKVQRNASALLSLISDLLDLAKIEAGRMSVELKHVEVSECLREAVDAVEPQLAQKGLKLEVACADFWALADFDRVRQILVNLLANAVKFTDHGVIRASVRGQGSEIIVDVADTGPGIPVELHEMIFAEFTQVARSPTAGTGLGLTIARRLAELQGGHLTVQSESGRGSIFTLALPAAGSLPNEPIERSYPAL